MLENDLEYNPYWAISRLARSSVFTDKVRLTSSSTEFVWGNACSSLSSPEIAFGGLALVCWDARLEEAKP